MDLLKGNVKTLYFRLLRASVGSALVASVFAMVDAMMVGRYHGPAGTAALAVFNPVWSIVYSIGILVGSGGAVYFANLRGQARTKDSDEYFTVSVIYGVILSVLAMTGIGIFHEPLLRFFGADDALLHLARQYLMPIWFAIPCCVFDNILSAYLRNDGSAELAMGAVLAGGIFNVFGDYFFVFVLDMGILGAGLATAIGLYITTLVMLSHFLSRKNTLRLVKHRRTGIKMLKISKTGFSTAISDLSMGIISVLFNRQIMRYLGTDALAVYGLLTQVVAFVQCCSYGAGQAAQPIMSQNHGAGQPERIKQCLKYALYSCFAFGLMWTAATELAPNLFVNLFMAPTPAVLAAAPAIIRRYCISFLLLPFNVFATYYFQAVMKPEISMAASVGRGVVLSGGLILALPALFGADTLWFAMPLTEIVVMVYCIWHMLPRDKRA